MRFSKGQTPDNVIVLSSLFILGVYGYLLVTFVGNDAISSFTTDSANYLVMARFLSPWHESAQALVAAWPQQDFPVLFPLLLAISGAAHDYYLAHAVTALLLVVSLPLIYALARAIRLNRIQSFLVTFFLAISPAAWMHSLGILSENLYILLSLLTLLLYQRLDQANRKQLIAFGLLLAGVVLTRTIGISLLAGYALLLGIGFWRERRLNITACIPLVIAVSLVMLTELFHSTTVPDQYVDQMLGVVANGNEHSEIEFNLLQQVKALVDAWFVSWMYYWNSNLLLSYLAFAVIGLLGLFGMLYRSVKLELDAVYLAIYLLILALWPHPGQAARFIYPVLFLLLINACIAGRLALASVSLKTRYYLGAFVVLLALASIVPAQLYTYERHELGAELECQYFREFYMLPDLAEAKAECVVQRTMLQDLAELRRMTGEDDRIMYFVPAYVALLADRTGVELRFAREASGRVVLQRDRQVEYVYLSRLHPRKTRKSINGLAIAGYFEDWTTLVHTSYSSETGEPVSLLLQAHR